MSTRQNNSRPWWKRLTPQVIAVVILALVVAGVATMTLNWLLRGEPFWSWPNPVPVPAATGTRDAKGAEPLDLVKVALTIAAGLGGAVALTVAYRKQQLAERDEQRALREETRSQDRVHRDQYGAGAAQLGDEDPAVRLAGVYAMANLADSWDEQRQQCVDVLCAYLRLPWQPPDPDHPIAAKNVEQTHAELPTIKTTYLYPNQTGEAEIRKTILRVIAEHLRDPHQGPIVADLHPGTWSTLRLDFTGATLPALDWPRTVIPAGVSFERASFTGSTSFVHARFSGQALFGEATFGGQASFSGAVFNGVPSFTKSEFTKKVLFDATEFTGAAQFSRATFVGPANFWTASFAGPTTFERARFAENASFRNVTFAGSTRFKVTIFTEESAFNVASFTGEALFDEAQFGGDVWFGQVTFAQTPSFKVAKFAGNISNDIRRYLTAEQTAHLTGTKRRCWKGVTRRRR